MQRPASLLFSWLLLSLFAFSSIPANAAIGDAEAVNLAGMQRMLTQRIGASYLMVGAEVRTQQANMQLDDSMSRYEENLQALRSWAAARGTQEIQQQLQQLVNLWQPYRALAMRSPDRTAALQLIEMAEPLLQAAEELTLLIERHVAQPSSRLINLSGRQRMLSQRINMLYQARSWGVPVPQLETRLKDSINAFDAALNELRQSPENTPETLLMLDEATRQWNFSRQGFDLSTELRFVPTVISSTTNQLLQQMDQLTLSYVAAGS